MTLKFAIFCHFSDLTVQFENPTYALSEGETITVNVVASTDFSKAFSVAISYNGGGGKCCISGDICIVNISCFSPFDPIRKSLFAKSANH